MPADDVPDYETPVFTEAEVYMIVGWVAGSWGIEEESAIPVIEEAIQVVLNWDYENEDD